MRKTILNITKNLFKFCMLLFIFLAVFNIGALYGEFKESGDTILSFFLEEKSYSWGPYDAPPLALTKQLALFDNIKTLIYIALGFQALVYLVDYFIDPENHFITLLKDKVEQIQNKTEE